MSSAWTETACFVVIDEVNTPDSSRLCDVEEWKENYSRVVTARATGRYNSDSPS